MKEELTLHEVRNTKFLKEVRHIQNQ